jgi:Flagellar biosynthesis protein, FliO
MQDWLDGLAGPGYTQAILWTFAALLLLLIVLIIIKLIRSLTFGTFVAGGRNRKTRLAVMDATAVDSHRRLVLVRRDDIEHLLLIGGPTDVVVERDIRLAQARRPALTGDGGREVAAQPQQLPKRAPEPAPAPVRPATLPPRAPERPAAQALSRAFSQPAAAPQPPKAEPPRMPPAAPVSPLPHESRYAPAPRPPQPSFTPAKPEQPPFTPAKPEDDLDDALLKELEVSLDEQPPRNAARPKTASLDDEMTKLLGELSSHKR